MEGAYDYDAIIYIASFPTPRAAAWRTLAMARAIENEAFVFAVNRTGDDIYCNYSGGSIAVDSFGDILSDCGSVEAVLTVEIDIKTLKERRRNFPTLRDADLFDII